MSNFNDDFRGGGTGRGAYTLIANSATQTPLTIQLAASATADGFLIENSAGTDLFKVDPSGNITIAGNITAIINETITGNVDITGTISVTGTSTLTGAVTAGSTITATGNIRTNASLTVDENATFGGITSATAMHLRLRTAAPSNIGSNGILYVQSGDTDTSELFYRDAAGNSVQLTDAGAIAGGAHFDDDENLTFGNTSASPDFTIDWETADADAHYVNFAVSSASRNIIISEDRNIDWTHAAQTNPTLWIQSADSGTVAQYLSLAHDQTNSVITSGTGALVVNATALLPDANDAYALGASGTAFSDVFLAAGGVFNFNEGKSTLTNSANALLIGNAALSGGSSNVIFQPANHTAVTANTIQHHWQANTITITGSYTPQAFNVFEAPTITAASSLTVTTAATVVIAGAPIAAGSASISTPLALWIQSGLSLFAGAVTTNGAFTATTGAVQMGTAAADTSTFTMIKGAQTGDPQFQISLTADDQGDTTIATDTGDIIINAGSSSNQIFVEKDSGFVGIGVNTPAFKLDVGGTVFGDTLRSGVAQSLAAWGVNGTTLRLAAATYTDTSTAESGTAATAAFYTFGVPTLAATNLTVTTTDAATVYIAGAPANGTNNTISNPYSLWVDAGTTRLDSLTWVGGTARADGLFACAQNTVGIVISQGAADNDVLTFKSSDVAHGMTSFGETDTFGAIVKYDGAGGGLLITGWTDANVAVASTLRLRAYSGVAADTTKTTSGEGIINFRAAIINGTTRATVAAGGNIATISDDSSGLTHFIFGVDAFHSNFALTEYDEYDDLALTRAFAIASKDAGAKGFINSEFDKFVNYNEKTLIDAGLLGAPLKDGGLVNITGMIKLHTGAFGQVRETFYRIKDEIEDLRSRLLEAESKLALLTA